MLLSVADVRCGRKERIRKEEACTCGLLLAYVKGKAYGFSLIPLISLISLVRLHHYLLTVAKVYIALLGILYLAALQIVVDVRLLTLDP